MDHPLVWLFTMLVLVGITIMVVGCGSGGYAGGGITSLSKSAVTIDAGQTFSVNAVVIGSSKVAWTLSGGCTGSACGTVVASGSTATYTAPAGLTTQMKVTLLAGISGTSESQSVSITVNPDPTITSPLPGGKVGTAYTTTLVASGGTAPLKAISVVGEMPPGLTFNATTSTISGTPTTVGTYNFTAQVTDSSDIPFTASVPESITIGSSGTTVTIAVSGAPPAGTVGAAYTTSLTATGGTGPYTFTLASGYLPAGLTLASNGTISGTPTANGTFTFTAQARDANNATGTGSFTITVAAATSTLTITTGTLPNGTVNVPYSATIGASGGTAPYSCSIASGTLPAGLTLGANCAVTGTPTTAGTSTLTVKVTDSSSPTGTATGTVSITIAPAALTITTGTLPNGTVNVPYSSTIGASGGTAPYSCSITSGTLPAGLTLAANCAVTGTPTTAGTSTLTVKVTDSSSPAGTATGTVSITIAPAALTITTGTLPNGTVNVPYSATIGASGGTAPYSCSITSGTLPAGLTLGANCAVTGTPTTAGTSTLTVKVTDSSSPTGTATGSVSITIAPAPLVLTTGTLPNGTVGTPYSATVGVSGGIAPYSCSIVSGTLPAGLTLGANCAITGTPTTPGTSNLSIKATDSSSPANSVTGPVSITINPAGLSITIGVLVDGTVGIPYSSIIGVLGGLGPIDCQITAGALPAGLTLGAGCVVSGTPTTAGTVTITVKATDSSTPPLTVTANITITIHPAALVLTLPLLPGGTVGQPYSATVGVTGGTAPYSCSVVSGTLPAGLSFTTGCTIAGTPTVAGTSIFTVRATDSGSPQQSVTGPETIVILPAIPLLTINAPPAGTVNVPYTGSIGVVGGTGPYTCTINSGTLPAGLSLGANCAITGTPTTAGSSTVNVTVKDSSLPLLSLTGNTTIVINPNSGSTLTLSNPPSATAGVPYTGTIGVAGGTSPYNCIINSGTLPVGLTLGANCAISGTPTTAGTATVNVTATDSATPQGTVTGNVTITVGAASPLSLTGSLPNAILGQPYTQTLTASGGVGPYTYAVTAGSLPAGLSLASSTGVISGTPTAVGASSFTVTATDSEGTPQTASLPLVLLVTYPVTPNDPAFKGPYAFLFQGYDDALVGVLASHTATVGSFTADGAGVLNSGELDSNHQASNPTGNTINSNSFIGTYTIGTDYRGSMAITTLNADGTTGRTRIYAIALKAPATAGTASTRSTMIESDDNSLQGTKGSGTILAQTTGSFTTGLTGSYAFGLSGDTPCLLTCAASLIGGPVAAVGQFTVNGSGAIMSGGSDANIATTNYANTSLSGTYSSADGNGRLTMTMNTSGARSDYPTDYAVYMVDANNAFIMSVDKHSTYILLAGTAQSQTGTFNNASMSGPYVGYENAPTNPGLVGTTLQNVLNLSTATVFRGTANGSGTCNTTNVDQGGVTGLVNGLTGLGSGSNILNAVLGTYATTGNSSCTVTSTGRGVLAYPAPSGLLATTLALLGLGGNPPAPRVVYLTSSRTGYFLETGYAGLGRIEAQTGAPFSLATFNGTYISGSAPASSVASVDTSGVIVADGAGHATTTSDLNIGVGTLNVIQLGVGGTFNYTLTDATAGRYTSGTTVIYAISPTRFVSVDTNALTTSPSVNLLY